MVTSISGALMASEDSASRVAGAARPQDVGDEHRFLALDALRGVAAISVLLVHIGYLGGYRWLAPFGYLAVDLFFVMSGLVIGYAYERKLLEGMRWRSFMAIRAARLYPALFLGILIGMGAQLWLDGGSSGLGLHSFGQFLVVPDFTSPELFPLNGVIWSLFLEVVVNAAHAAAVRRLSTPRLATLVVVCGIAWAWTAGSSGNWGGGWGWSTVAGGLARVGWGYGVGLLYRLVIAGRLTPPAISAVWPVAAALFLLLMPRFGAGTPRIAMTLFLLFPVIVLLALRARIPPSARRLATWLGALSYPLYAIHYPLLLIATGIIGTRPGAAALWAGTGLAMVLFAAAIAYLYERPARAWLRCRLQHSPTAIPRR
jgi:peptidoglycan/LPS O-acetylase OafA/YrhL